MPSLRSVARTKLFRAAAACLVAAVLFWVFRTPLLRVTAHLWIVDETPVSAQAIVVLGGGEDYRPFAAAKLWKDGLAPVILVPRVKPSPTESLGLRPGTTQVILAVLKAEGVPDSAVQLVGQDVSSTREEALAAREWWERVGDQAGSRPSETSTPAPAAGPKPETRAPVFLIPTDPFPTRRTNWFFEKTLPPDSDVRIISVNPPGYTPDDWWQNEAGLIQFQNEVIKWLFYRVKY